MLYLLDTNIVSELRKGSRCAPAVAAWEQAELIPHSGAISVITIGEIRKGIDLIAQRDPLQAAKVHGLILATRNERDLRDVGLRVVNPFEFRAGA